MTLEQRVYNRCIVCRRVMMGRYGLFLHGTSPGARAFIYRRSTILVLVRVCTIFFFGSCTSTLVERVREVIKFFHFLAEEEGGSSRSGARFVSDGYHSAHRRTRGARFYYRWSAPELGLVGDREYMTKNRLHHSRGGVTMHMVRPKGSGGGWFV